MAALDTTGELDRACRPGVERIGAAIDDCWLAGVDVPEAEVALPAA
jgi:hypothetical protein